MFPEIKGIKGLGITRTEREQLVNEYIPFFLSQFQPLDCSRSATQLLTKKGNLINCTATQDKIERYNGNGYSCRKLYDSAALKKSLLLAAGQKDARSILAVTNIPAALLKCPPDYLENSTPVIPLDIAKALNETEDLTSWAGPNWLYFITNLMWFIAYNPNEKAVVEALQALQRSPIPVLWVPIIKNGIQIFKDRAIEGAGTALKAKYLYEVEAHVDQILAEQAAEAARKAAAMAAGAPAPAPQVAPLPDLPGFGPAIPPAAPKKKKVDVKSIAILGGAVAFAGAIFALAMKNR